MTGMLILQFIVLMAVVTGGIIFFLYRFLIASTDGAVKRLNTETETVRGKQSELNKKIKEADEELAKRKKEAEDLTKKMREEAEETAKAEREKMIKKAREEGEEIISKAQRTKDQIRIEIQKEMDIKAVDYAIQVLNIVLSEKAKGVIDQKLLAEFLDSLERMDMNQVTIEADTADIVTAVPIDSVFEEKFRKVIKAKLDRDVKVNSTIDPSIAGGAVLRFGSLALDGSLQNMIREAGIAMKQKVEGS